MIEILPSKCSFSFLRMFLFIERVDQGFYCSPKAFLQMFILISVLNWKVSISHWHQIPSLDSPVSLLPRNPPGYSMFVFKEEIRFPKRQLLPENCRHTRWNQVMFFNLSSYSWTPSIALHISFTTSVRDDSHLSPPLYGILLFQFYFIVLRSWSLLYLCFFFSLLCSLLLWLDCNDIQWFSLLSVTLLCEAKAQVDVKFPTLQIQDTLLWNLSKLMWQIYL